MQQHYGGRVSLPTNPNVVETHIIFGMALRVLFFGRGTGDALGNGRTAVFLECGRIMHAVADALALLALGDALADFLGMQF